MPVDLIENESGGVLTLTLRGTQAAVVVLRGRWGAAETSRLDRVLRAVVEMDVPRVIVDVASIEVGHSLAAVVRSVRFEMRRRGGWLLVEGDADRLLSGTSPLVEAFRAYREAVEASAEPAVA